MGFSLQTEATVTDCSQLPVILSTQDLMKLTGLSRPSIYNLLQEAIHTGIFPVRRAGAKYLVSRDGFLAWLGKE